MNFFAILFLALFLFGMEDEIQNVRVLKQFYYIFSFSFQLQQTREIEIFFPLFPWWVSRSKWDPRLLKVLTAW